MGFFTYRTCRSGFSPLPPIRATKCWPHGVDCGVNLTKCTIRDFPCRIAGFARGGVGTCPFRKIRIFRRKSTTCHRSHNSSRIKCGLSKGIKKSYVPQSSVLYVCIVHSMKFNVFPKLGLLKCGMRIKLGIKNTRIWDVIFLNEMYFSIKVIFFVSVWI